MLEDYGADALNISAGTYASWDVIVPPTSWEEGWNWRICRRIREIVNIPVGLAGRFTDPVIIEQSIERGDADFICLGRQSIADPEFPNKMAGGELNDIVPCVGCTQRCMSFNDHDTLQEGDWGVSCIFNPMSNNRKDVQYDPTDNPKKVMIIGAGVAGLEAGWIAAVRGHNVALYEQNDVSKTGGQFLLAAYPPYKQELLKPIKHYKHMCEKYGVKMNYNTKVDTAFIKSENPDVLIVATGAKPFKLNIPGNDADNVYMANDVLVGKKILANSVLVIGGGMVGSETAEFCRDYCERVAVVEALEDIAMDLYMTVREDMIKRFKNKNIEVYKNTTVTKIEGKTVHAERLGETIKLENFDNIIFAVGSKSEMQFENVESLAKEVYVIGDAKEARSALQAIYEGFRVAQKI